jgi:casein kinase I family protein HRR25
MSITILRPQREGKSFTGTTRYASIAAHVGHEIGRKDDLESLLYVMIYCIKGYSFFPIYGSKLPWQNQPFAADRDRTDAVGDMKSSITPKDLCKEMPAEICECLMYTIFKNRKLFAYTQVSPRAQLRAAARQGQASS